MPKGYIEIRILFLFVAALVLELGSEAILLAKVSLCTGIDAQLTIKRN